jgi:hypothetical protein
MVAATKAGGPPPEVMIQITKAHDGLAGDGHKFVPGTGGEGTSYGPESCAECGYRIDAEVFDGYEPGSRDTKINPRSAHPNG